MRSPEDIRTALGEKVAEARARAVRTAAADALEGLREALEPTRWRPASQLHRDELAEVTAVVTNFVTLLRELIPELPVRPAAEESTP